MATIKSTDETFEKLKNENKNFLAVMSAKSWCSPCRVLSEIINSKEFSLEIEKVQAQIVIAEHDIDSEPNVPVTLSVRGVPTLLLFKDGKLKSKKVGAPIQSHLVSWIKENI